MRHLTILVVMLVCGTRLFAADVKLHKFEFWGLMNSLQDPMTLKVAFLQGFNNGFAVGVSPPACKDGRPALEFFRCLFVDNKMSTAQAVAMIDKYYRDNPEKWNLAIGDAIVEALSVKESPCAGQTPRK
jgi:hypothetical protein